MNDFLLIFMGIFILLLIFLIFILLAYVYHTYTTYTVDINKNLETSEDAINNTSTAFNKLQDTVINELAKVNKNQETVITTIPNNLTSLNSNLLNIFDISSNNNKISDISCYERKRYAGKKKVNEFRDGFYILFYIIKSIFKK